MSDDRMLKYGDRLLSFLTYLHVNIDCSFRDLNLEDQCDKQRT